MGVYILDPTSSASLSSKRARPLARIGLLALFVLPALVAASASAQQGIDSQVRNVSKAPGAAVPASSQQYGFVMALLDNDDDVAGMGFGWVQYGVYWKDAEPSPEPSIGATWTTSSAMHKPPTSAF